jgi:RNA polymerase primary sigma factor
LTQPETSDHNNSDLPDIQAEQIPFENGDFGADEIAKLLIQIDDEPLPVEPDITTLPLETGEDEESAEYVTSDEILVAQKVLAELGDDPVRLYLKDIGAIELLDVSHEFWLSARMFAIRRLDAISRQHSLAKRGISPTSNIYRALFAEMTTAWGRAIEDIRRLKFECPDLLRGANPPPHLGKGGTILFASLFG